MSTGQDRGLTQSLPRPWQHLPHTFNLCSLSTYCVPASTYSMVVPVGRNLRSALAAASLFPAGRLRDGDVGKRAVAA